MSNPHVNYKKMIRSDTKCLYPTKCFLFKLYYFIRYMKTTIKENQSLKTTIEQKIKTAP